MKFRHKSFDSSYVNRFSAICLILFLIIGSFVLGDFYGDGRITFGSTNSTGLPATLNYSSINAVYNALRANYDGKLTESQVLDGLKHGLAEAANDPYTEYFTAAEAKDFSNELNGAFSGIGAELGADNTGNIQVISPISGTPAAKAGLQAGDIIATINNQSTSGMSVDTAVSKIRGKAGTTVTLGVIRSNNDFLLNIKRQNITIPSVTTKILSGNIGYMQISTFADDTSNLASQAANQFSSAKVKGIVLDLRNDPGGLLSAAINVSSLWLPQSKLVLQEKKGNTVIQSFYSDGSDPLNGIPTVILINGGSASASEITTGALHDNGQAYVIGTQSYGKGVVQQLISFKNGSELKVTVASWYRPDGQDINKKGITPDKVVNPTSQEIGSANDNQLNAALTYLMNK